ncbi:MULTISPECIES: HEPN/Toprim-associated domain-containing protein [unclassified Polaromonas]|uniref:HEPN/Toprim-associated domain-containing protein n=1 Tax=unclassified Polaromonas TaxID=2638319 RepID=UPI000BCA8ED2|nr:MULTISPECIES: HEPN/Toprim-associated domain-containing protein [unclassified Polaromonas]OYY35293.1 MAG: hypothetical protein B7Y60_13295 [Polaromonas sp. 35-63-35]OYZ19101.1 MAG: hypothetical protein B7Y28_13980 [Polaromonas sp. 16-63-31]OZA48758.1 MAG: hypothetical protein B7X88_17620 [Polaromonas sp. 17-63-33]HQR99119.1 HEPN/Toprim-associated domain-containing protein [Polaromonas sp.]HQS39978.1 HEPN/Toprim-associated domain-containing protein [Polaromonas sp.]
MGSYAKCWLGDLNVGSSRNEIDPNLISLFRQQDKVVLSAPFHKLPASLEHYRESLEEDSDLKLVYYQVPVNVVRDRLEVLGYTITTVEDAFREWVKGEHAQKIESMKVWAEQDSETRKLMEDHYRTDAEILASVTPRSWIEGLKMIRSSELETSYHARFEGPHKGTLIGYMLSNEWYGFPGYDVFVPLRLAIEAFGDDGDLIYDLTDLVWSSNFDEGEDFVEFGLGVSAAEYSSMAKTIVLTEGKTDAWILSESFKVLYPHLQDYFSFLDFESTGYGGGVGNLANVVKAFAGAGIVNNVVALFDNDTAAAAACKAIEKIALPANIVIRQLPKLDFLENYPTIGPTGAAKLDVNGIAASIELYLGEDVLRLDSGNLAVVQWTGYEKSVNQYQGELLEKSKVQARFREKLSRHSGPAGPDWDGLRAVFRVLFSAFEEKNRGAICKRPTEYYGVS